MAVTALFNRKIEMVIGLFVDSATAILATAVYGLALGGSISLEIRAPLLDAVPLSLGPAAFLYFFTRIALPRARRTALLIEARFVIIVLGGGTGHPLCSTRPGRARSAVHRAAASQDGNA